MANDLATLARQHFGVTLPIERDALKSLYRRAARKLHTDTAGDGSKDAFVVMDLAYKALCTAPGGVFTDQPSEHCTTEGTPLTDLGHGLGHTKNGVECSECGGSGYEKRHEVVVKWWPYEPCEKCVFLRSTLGCRICGHLKWHRTEKHDWVYYICAPCKGTGEIEVLNPVIPKGFLTGGTYLGQKARKRLEQHANLSAK